MLLCLRLQFGDALLQISAAAEVSRNCRFDAGSADGAQRERDNRADAERWFAAANGDQGSRAVFTYTNGTFHRWELPKELAGARVLAVADAASSSATAKNAPIRPGTDDDPGTAGIAILQSERQ